MRNGELLTLKISGFPKTARECSLSDILEENPGEEYYLSEQTTRRLLSYKDTTIL